MKAYCRPTVSTTRNHLNNNYIKNNDDNDNKNNNNKITYSSPCSAFKSASKSFEISSKKRKANRLG